MRGGRTRRGCSAGSRLPPQLLFCRPCPQAGGIHICIIHKETPTLPPNQCQWRGLHRYLSASRVSPSFFVLHSLIHWYLSAKGGLSSCPHGIVFILAQSSSHPDSNGRVYSPNRGLENWENLWSMFLSSPNACYLNPIADITLWICVPLTSNRQMKAKHVECWR